MHKPTLADFMTACPHTIGAEETLAVAHVLMRTHQVHHLPVLRQGALVGMLSERDLLLIESFGAVDPGSTLVEEAMSERPVAQSPRTSLEWVAAEMAQLKIGSVIVVERERIVGVFTCVDALRALQHLLGRARRRGRHAPAHGAP